MDHPTGRIDVHSHLLPGVDDGCADFNESLESIEQLRKLGYVGSICTPHIVPQIYPMNTPTHLKGRVAQLAERLASTGVSYRIWTGGELRLSASCIDWMKAHDVPTLAGSRCVLTEFWEAKWPKWVHRTYEWLLAEGFQPVLAHPERIPATDKLEQDLLGLVEMGVWLQGNFRSFTGEEGGVADRIARQLLTDKRFTFLALDMHRPESLPVRFDGFQLVADDFGTDLLDAMTIDAPHRLIIGDQIDAPAS